MMKMKILDIYKSYSDLYFTWGKVVNILPSVAGSCLAHLFHPHIKCVLEVWLRKNTKYILPDRQ